MSKKALGRGIDALLQADDEAGVRDVPVEAVRPGKGQPREYFSETALEELAQSIKQKGILQPLLVEESTAGQYTIVAGERRFRAARIAGLKQVPVLIRAFSEVEKLEIGLIENLQREDLSPIEEARAYRNLMEIGRCKQEDVARRVGKSRSTVANSLRLLNLPEDMIEALHRGTLSAGHARAILSVNDDTERLALFEKIVSEGLSVRATEKVATGKTEQPKKKNKVKKSSELRFLEEQLIQLLGTKVIINGSDNRGRIEISYYSADDLDRIWSLFSR